QAALRRREMPAGSALEVFSDAACGDGGKPVSYVRRWICGMQAIEGAANVRSLDYICTSDLFSLGSPDQSSATAFIVHLLTNAREFAAAYNSALAEYRTCRGIHVTDHPIPYLAIDGDRVEILCWF